MHLPFSGRVISTPLVFAFLIILVTLAIYLTLTVIKANQEPVNPGLPTSSVDLRSEPSRPEPMTSPVVLPTPTIESEDFSSN